MKFYDKLNLGRLMFIELLLSCICEEHSNEIDDPF